MGVQYVQVMEESREFILPEHGHDIASPGSPRLAQNPSHVEEVRNWLRELMFRAGYAQYEMNGPCGDLREEVRDVLEGLCAKIRTKINGCRAYVYRPAVIRVNVERGDRGDLQIDAQFDPWNKICTTIGPVLTCGELLDHERGEPEAAKILLATVKEVVPSAGYTWVSLKDYDRPRNPQ